MGKCIHTDITHRNEVYQFIDHQKRRAVIQWDPDILDPDVRPPTNNAGIQMTLKVPSARLCVKEESPTVQDKNIRP
jgi:hypothetical protein